MTNEQAYARASQRMTGVIAGLSPDDAVKVLENLRRLVHESLQRQYEREERNR